MQALRGNEFSIIIPTYREADNISVLIEEIAKVNFQNKTFEVIIVDDNSQDGTLEIVNHLKAQYTWLNILIRQKKRSLSLSIMDGLAISRFPNLIIMDADLSHPANKIPEMLAYLQDPNIDMVIGSRYIKGGSSDEEWPLARKLLSKASVFIVQLLLSIRVKDPLSGFIAFRKADNFSNDIIEPISWKIGLEMMIRHHYKNIQEVPIRFEKRRHGSSKLTIRVAYDCLRHVLKLRKIRGES